MDYRAGGKWFIHGPKRRKENQLLSLEHPCWLSLVYSMYIWRPWQLVQSVIRKEMSVDNDILGRLLKIETASQT